MENVASQLLAPIKPQTASGVVKITAVSHWAFAANDPIVHRGCSVFSRRVASERIDYNWFRYYDPSIGRYITSDPIGLNGGVNTYGYAYQNPVMNIDPDGRLVWFAALPFLGGGAATSTAGGLGFLGTGALLGGALVVSAIPGSTPQDRANSDSSAQRQKEYQRAKNRCDKKPPSTGDKCADLSREIDHYKNCANWFE